MRNPLRNLVLVLTLFASFYSFSAPLLTGGYDPNASKDGAVRWRNFANFPFTEEVRLGLTPLTLGGIFNTGNLTWSANPTHVKFIYDGDVTLRTEVGLVPVVVTYTLAVPPVGPVNYFEINLCNSNRTAVALNAVKLDGEAVANFLFPIGCRTWSITNIDKTGGFTLEGDILFYNYQSGLDASLVQVAFGNYTPSAESAPTVSDVAVTPVPVLLNGPAMVTASADDLGQGNNLIKDADYSVNGEPWTVMTAQDGAFDWFREDVEAGFTGLQVGENEICVRATDVLGNVSNPQCQTFTVTYQFDGFFSPIDSAVMNFAKAGQAIPVKWRLIDGNAAPISDPGSFAGLWSYPISCSDASALPGDAVEEYASGASGLQYKDDGYWQFNWKTPKNYAGSCRAMYVLFNSGIASPITTFQFKK